MSFFGKLSFTKCKESCQGKETQGNKKRQQKIYEINIYTKTLKGSLGLLVSLPESDF